MCNAAQIRIRAGLERALKGYLDSLSKTDNPPSKEQLTKIFIPDADPVFIRDTESLIATALLLGMDHAHRKLDMAEEIPALPFEEAVSFMKGRIPLTKREWNTLEQKLRFRAFTVARLAQCDYIDTARQVLYKAMDSGKGVAETYRQWQTLQTLVQDDAMKLRPGYWENVFRTNTQTAYTAGKLMQFQNNPPPAWRLLIVDDSRTSNICRGLLQKGKQSLALKSDHPFWQAFGYPPYHFQCRTGLQAVYKSEMEDGGADIENPGMEDVKSRFKPMDGFGGNPIDSGNYYMMTKGMFERGLRYGVINEFNHLDNIVADFYSVWKDYTREKHGKGWIDIHKDARTRSEFDKNYKIAIKEAALGNNVKMLPVPEGRGIIKWKTSDYLMNNNLWELESRAGTKSSIDRGIRDGQKQSLNLIIQVPMSADRITVLRAIYNRFTHPLYPSTVKKLILYHGDIRNQWTAEEIKRWERP